MLNTQIAMDTGNAQVHLQRYVDDPELAASLPPERVAALTARLGARAGVRGVAPRLVVEGLLQSAYGTRGVSVRGVDPARELRVTEVGRRLPRGRWLAGDGEIVLGASLAEALDVRLGERVVLQVQGLSRTRSRGLRLVGVAHTGLAQLDRAAAFVPLADARALTGVAGANEIALALARGVDDRAFVRALQTELDDDLAASSFFDLNPLFGLIVELGLARNLFLMALLATLAGFGVANTVMFTVLRRIREFGVLLALGLRPRQLARLITLEAVLISAVGFVAGGVLGFALNLYLQEIGISFAFYSDVFPDVGMPQVIYAKVDWVHGLYALGVVVLTAVLAARYPARRAAQLEPTEAMRYV
jgi:ABC-type lipoprotein release transport system permease subunit